MPAKRDPLLTAKGTRYTYAGWVRAFNAALKNGGSNLAYRLGDSYPDFYNKHYAQLRKNDLGSRQHAPNPGNPPKPKQSKPKQSKPKQSKPSAKRPVFGNPPPSVPKKPTRKAEYTPRQRALIREIFHYEREIEHATDRMLHSHGAARSPEEKKLSDLRGKQREAELKLYRLNKSAAEKTQARITERNNKYHNKRVRDTKKKEAFQEGKFTAGYWLH